MKKGTFFALFKNFFTFFFATYTKTSIFATDSQELSYATKNEHTNLLERLGRLKRR
jgi:hypothetical protein